MFPRARANAGDAWRLEATLRRLESGRCIQVAVIGEAPQQLPCMQAEAYAERFVGLLQRHHPCVDRHGRRGHHALLVSVYQSVELTRPASKARPAVIVIETRPRRTRGEHEPRGAFKFKLLDVMVFRQQ